MYSEACCNEMPPGCVRAVENPRTLRLEGKAMLLMEVLLATRDKEWSSGIIFVVQTWRLLCRLGEHPTDFNLSLTMPGTVTILVPSPTTTSRCY